MDRTHTHRLRPDTVFSNESLDSIYLQYGLGSVNDEHDEHARDSVYNLPVHEIESNATLATAPTNGTSPNLHMPVPLNGTSHSPPLPRLLSRTGIRGHRRQDSVISSISTDTLAASSQENLIRHAPPADPSAEHQATVDRNLSLNSLYRRDTRSRMNTYLPRVPLQPIMGHGVGIAQGHHRRQTSDFSLVSNGSELTLVHSNKSHLDVDLEKGRGPHGLSKLELVGGDLDANKELPMPPVTPTPKRVLRRTGLCCGLCCFGTLVLACLCAVSFMMLAVNANLDGWGHRSVVHMPFGLQSPRLGVQVGEEEEASRSVLFQAVPTVSVQS